MTITATIAPAEEPRPRTGRPITPVTPGKVALWLFLATEVMFFTGLIGSYIVFRAGSPRTGYSNAYSPATPLERLLDTEGVLIKSAGPNPAAVTEALHAHAGLTEAAAERVLEAVPHGMAGGFKKTRAEAVAARLKAAGAEVEIQPLAIHKWPAPYDPLTNPLAIDLTAFNTFVLICSSVTMALALQSIRDGKRLRCSLFLLATVAIGSLFLSIQVYEYYQLMVGHHYPIGISATGHFRPGSSLFASCFFTMTGFHGAHVTAGVIALSLIFIRSLFRGFSAENHAPVELVGLYWHFVDLVWIILFTIVYLM